MESKQRPVYCLLRDVQRSRTAALRLPWIRTRRRRTLPPDTRRRRAGPARQAAPSAAMTGEGPHAVNFWPLLLGLAAIPRRGCSPWRSCRWRHLGTALRRDRAPDGRHRRLGHALVRAGRAVLGKPPLAFWAPALSIKLLEPVRVQPAPACSPPCWACWRWSMLRRAPVRRQRRALGRAGVRHHAAAAGQRRRGAHRSLPGAGRDAVDDVLPAGAARRPRGGAMAFRGPGDRPAVEAAGPGAGGGRRIALVAAARRTRSGARCPGSAARS